MPLKLNEEGHAVIEDGKPIWVMEGGKETPFDIENSINKIGTLKTDLETKTTELTTATASLAAYKGITPEDATKNATTIGTLDETLRLDAEKNAQYLKDTLSQHVDPLTQKIETLEATNLQQSNEIDFSVMFQSFSSSKFIKDKMINNPDVLLKVYGNNFKVEKNDQGINRCVGYLNGNRILSSDPSRLGQVADFEESIIAILKADPNMNSMLKAPEGGSGSGGGSQHNNSQNKNLSSVERIAQGLRNRK